MTPDKVPFLDLWGLHSEIWPKLLESFEQSVKSSSFIQGDSVRLFEKQFAEYHGSNFYCSSCANGTDALVMAIHALLGRENSKGKEILVPANSFFATAEAVCLNGFTPVFVEPDPHLYTISIDDIKKKITKNTVAIIPVHLYGQMANIEAIQELAQKHNLKVIEDSAQSHGALWNKQAPATYSDVAIYSFYPGKNLGALGDGGCIVTKSLDFSQKFSKLANHGRTNKYEHQLVGYNSRLDALQAKFLSIKLGSLDEVNLRRQQIASIYNEAFASTNGLTVPTIAAQANHVFHLYVVRSQARDSLAKHLKSKNIETGVHYPLALTELEAMINLDPKYKQCPIAEAYSKQVLSLPMGPHLSDSQIHKVIDGVRSF